MAADPIVVILNVMLLLATYNMLVPGSAIYGLQQQMKKLQRELRNKNVAAAAAFAEEGCSTEDFGEVSVYRKINPVDAAFTMCILIVNVVYFPFRSTV